MTVQGGNAINHGVSYKGQVADQQLCNTVSRLNKSGAGIEYGTGVVSDGEGAAQAPDAASVLADFNGVVMRELNRAVADGAAHEAPDDRDMTVVTEGVVWVEVLDTVVKDADVYLRVGSTGTGDFSGIVGTGATLGIQITNAKFLTGGDAGDLVQISLGLGG
jgi:hypothetical protein